MAAATGLGVAGFLLAVCGLIRRRLRGAAALRWPELVGVDRRRVLRQIRSASIPAADEVPGVQAVAARLGRQSAHGVITYGGMTVTSRGVALLSWGDAVSWLGAALAAVLGFGAWYERRDARRARHFLDLTAGPEGSHHG